MVGIGASAGGLNALKIFFENTPADSGMAYVVVVHLSPEHKSVLAELLQPYVKMPVQQVTKTMELRADHVYVIPPNANLNTIDTHLRLSQLEKKIGARAPIDHFFRTLAKIHAEKSIGIILTGTGSDGTLGLKEIKARGGLTIVQDPSDAEYDGMPQSAVETGLIDMIIPLKEIPTNLVKYVNTRPQIKSAKSEKEYSKGDLQVLQKIFSQVKARTRRDFTNYKISTLVRRLQRRMQIYQIEDVTQYLNLLRKNPEEVKTLSDDFLINVTSFFRDEKAFNYLSEKVIPQILDKKRQDEQLRVWSVGCATGEEAYSLAILIDEALQKMDYDLPVQIFASDLYEPALEKAREGYFPGDIKTDISSDRLHKYFTKENAGYRIQKGLREHVIFTPHNLLGDPPFSRIDLVVCRNLLIYLKRNIQRDVFELFHYALNPNGFLMLGTSETLESTDLYKTVSKENSVYRKKNVNGLEPRLPVFPTIQSQAGYHKINSRPIESASFGEIHLRLVEHYGPPSLLISPDYQVLHVSESAGKYMKISGGELSRDVFKLIHPEMMLELRSTIYSAKEQNRMVRSRPVRLQLDGKESILIISSRIVKEKENNDMILVMFEEYGEDFQLRKSRKKKDKEEVSHLAHIEDLETELHDTRQRLQAIIEEYETSREEMKASNEELQSANEELRSTLEELETSKEELQSMNEELTTLNLENRHKVEELSRLSNDLQNLMASTDIATLFLTRDLKIMRFTPKLTELFNVKPEDRGRKISDLTNHIGYDHLVSDANKVLKNLQPIENDLRDENGNVYFVRLLPYRSAEDKIDGLVVTFVDVSPIKNAELEKERSEEKYKALFESIDVGFCILEAVTDEKGITADFRFLETNPAFKLYSGLKKPEGSTLQDVVSGPEPFWQDVFKRVNETATPERFETEARLLGNRWFEVNVFKFGKMNENKIAVLFTDISYHKKQARELQKAKTDAENSARIKEDFLAHMSHEIRTPLNALVGLSHLLLEKSPKLAQKDNLITLKMAAENLSRLVNDVLDFSKIKAGKVQLESIAVELKAFASEIIEIHKNSADIKGLSIDYMIDESIPAIIQTDEHKLSHILHNLLSNAVKFTNEGNVSLEVNLHKKEKELLWLEFIVEDTGIGISEDKLEDIFDAFSQADNSTVRHYGGTGLGLAITKLYLEMLDSKIEVETRAGEGSKFSFVLPAKEVKESDIQPKEEKKDAEVNLTGTKILIAEDDDYNREILKQLFNMWKVSFDMAVNGMEAVDLFTKKPYDIILMDIRMPVMDGYEATTKIREMNNGGKIPVVVLTADVSKKVKDHVSNGIFTDIILKPVAPALLKQKIKEHVRL